MSYFTAHTTVQCHQRTLSLPDAGRSSSENHHPSPQNQNICPVFQHHQRTKSLPLCEESTKNGHKDSLSDAPGDVVLTQIVVKHNNNHTAAGCSSMESIVEDPPIEVQGQVKNRNATGNSPTLITRRGSTGCRTRQKLRQNTRQSTDAFLYMHANPKLGFNNYFGFRLVMRLYLVNKIICHIP